MQSPVILRGTLSFVDCPVPQEFDHSGPSLSPHPGVQSGVVEERERDRLNARLQPEPGRGVEVSGHDQAGECELPGRGVEVSGYDQAGECEPGW